MITKRILVCFWILLNSSIAGSAEPVASPPVAITDAPAGDEAKKAAVLLEFFSYSSVESKMVRDNLFTVPAVASALAEKCIVVPVELENEQSLRERYGVRSVPTFVLTRSDGTEIDRLVGLCRPEELLRLIKAASGESSELLELAARAEAPRAGLDARFALAAAYVKRGQYDKATAIEMSSLGRASAPGPERKYLNLIIARLVALGATYAPALDALRSHRDLLDKEPGVVTRDSALVLIALNEALKETPRTTELFLKFPEKSPLRRQLFPAVFMQLVEAGRYTEAAMTVDLETFVNNAYQTQPKEGHGHEHADHDENAYNDTAKITRERVIKLTAAAVQALVATSHVEKAKRLAGRAMDTYDGEDTRERLSKAAQQSRAKSAKDFTAWLESYPAAGGNASGGAARAK